MRTKFLRSLRSPGQGEICERRFLLLFGSVRRAEMMEKTARTTNLWLAGEMRTVLAKQIEARFACMRDERAQPATITINLCRAVTLLYTHNVLFSMNGGICANNLRKNEASVYARLCSCRKTQIAVNCRERNVHASIQSIETFLLKAHALYKCMRLRPSAEGRNVIEYITLQMVRLEH